MFLLRWIAFFSVLSAIAASPSQAASFTRGVSAWQWPCFTQQDAPNCVGVDDLKVFSGKPFVFRFAVYQELLDGGQVSLEDYQTAIDNISASGGKPVAVLMYARPYSAHRTVAFTQRVRTLQGVWAVQIHNEPNLGSGPSASEYARLLYCPAAKQLTQYSGKVLSAGLTPHHLSSYTKSMLGATKKCGHKINNIAVHPYAPKPEQTLKLVQQVRKTADRSGQHLARIYITEYGVPSQQMNITGGQLRVGKKNEQAQLAYLSKTDILLQKHSKSLKLDGAWWFGFHDLSLQQTRQAAKDGSRVMVRDATMGLFSENGQPKPAGQWLLGHW